MGVGTLNAAVFLDEPRMIRCGSTDTVSGHVAVTYRPSFSQSGTHPDLFGPLVVTVLFHGRAKTKVVKSNGNNRTTYRGRAPLFSFSTKIYEDSFKSGPNETHRFPFSLNFPDSVQPTPNQGHWAPDGRFSTNIGDPLPPTFILDYHGFAHRFTAFTEYRIGATVRMPNIDIKVGGISEDSEPIVLYERPRIKPQEMLQRFHQSKDCCKVQNEHLVEEDHRASGFKQKAKAMFKSDYYPEYHFEVHTKFPGHIFLGQPMTFEITIRPNESLCTAPITPEITMCAFNADISAHTEVRAERILLGEPQSNGNETVAKMTGRLIDSKEPFSKAKDYTKTITTPAVTGIPTSFSTFNISHTYTLELKYTIIAATKSFKVSKQIRVIVFPPLDLPPEFAAAGPSSRPVETAQPLPEYERPPEYHEVLEETQNGDDVHETGQGKGKSVAVA